MTGKGLGMTIEKLGMTGKGLGMTTNGFGYNNKITAWYLGMIDIS